MEALVGVILVEVVLGILAVVEECQGEGRFALFKLHHVPVVNAIPAEEIKDMVTDTVVSHLADKTAGKMEPAQGDDGIERGSTRPGSLWLVILEDDVKNSFAYGIYFVHKKHGAFYLTSVEMALKDSVPDTRASSKSMDSTVVRIAPSFCILPRATSLSAGYREETASVTTTG